jgi:hypothetical protein
MAMIKAVEGYDSIRQNPFAPGITADDSPIVVTLRNDD